MRYSAQLKHENGEEDFQDFDNWDEMIDWLADSPDAGMSAYDNEAQEPVDQRILQEQVELTVR